MYDREQFIDISIDSFDLIQSFSELCQTAFTPIGNYAKRPIREKGYYAKRGRPHQMEAYILSRFNSFFSLSRRN